MRFKIKDGRPVLCQHNPNLKKTSVILAKEVNFMVYPPMVYGVCPQCGRTFQFEIDELGKLIEQTETEKV